MAADILILAGSFTAYFGCGGGALWLGKQRRATGDRATRHGNNGEQRVAKALGNAGYAILTDITVQQGRGTHQIDHVVCGGTGFSCWKPRHGAGASRAGQGIGNGG